MRIRILKDYKNYRKGEIVEVSRNVAFGLIDSGNGTQSKEITERDIKTKRVKHGRSS